MFSVFEIEADEETIATIFFNLKLFFGQHQLSASNLSKISPDTRVCSHGEHCLLQIS